MVVKIDSKLGEINSIIGFGYKPNTKITATIIPKLISSLLLTSANILVFVVPNIVF